MPERPDDTTEETQSSESAVNVEASPVFTVTDPGRILQNPIEFLLEIFSAWIKNAEVRIEIQVASDLRDLHVDPVRLGRILEFVVDRLSGRGSWLLLCRNLRLPDAPTPGSPGMVEFGFFRKTGDLTGYHSRTPEISRNDLNKLQRDVSEACGDLRVQQTLGRIDCIWILLPAADHQDR